MCDLTLKGNCSIWRKKTTAHRWSHYDQKTCKGWESNRQDHKPIPLTITFSLTPGICWLTSSSGVSDTTLLHSNKYGEKYLIYLMELFQTKKKKFEGEMRSDEARDQPRDWSRQVPSPTSVSPFISVFTLRNVTRHIKIQPLQKRHQLHIFTVPSITRMLLCNLDLWSSR